MSNFNETLFLEAQKVIPGGVNSPVRAFKGVGGTPIFFNRACGAILFGEDNRNYTDYIGSWGAMIVGHGHPEVISAITHTAKNGLSFGAPTRQETTMATLLCELVPSMEQVRLVNSGTEAVMTAMRLARGYTGRNKIIKFSGCYHGHADSLLVSAGSGLLTASQASSAGIPSGVSDDTIVLPYNKVESFETCMAKFGDQIAGVIVEPIAGNMNLIVPNLQFLQSLRKMTEKMGSVLIFDEVMTGFRVALAGVQGLYQIKPDLTTLGKVIGGGLPIGALGGRKEIMQCLNPIGKVYQAGTLSGNPIAVSAGLATLNLVQAGNFYRDLTETAQIFVQGLEKIAEKTGVALRAQAVGGMFGFYFSPNIPQSYEEVVATDVEKFKHFFHAMLREGIYFAPSAFEAGFVSSAHSGEIIADTLAKVERVLSEM